MYVFFRIISTIIITIGVKLIFDARPISTQYFNESKKEDTVYILKLIGFIASVIGVLLFIFLETKG